MLAALLISFLISAISCSSSIKLEFSYFKGNGSIQFQNDQMGLFYHQERLYLYDGAVESIIVAYNFTLMDWETISRPLLTSDWYARWNWGAKGVASPNNIVGCREEAGTTFDKSRGLFYVFGGNDMYHGYVLSDLWVFNTSTNYWTWIGGPNAADVVGIFGTKGVGNPANRPPPKYGSSLVVDSTRNMLYLFGGYYWYCEGLNTNYNVFMNDMWRFNVSSGIWTWLSGFPMCDGTRPALPSYSGKVVQAPSFGTFRTESSNNTLTGRHFQSMVLLERTGEVFVYGGLSVTNCGDTWRFNATSSLWTWISGTPCGVSVFGITVPTPNVTSPSARYYSGMAVSQLTGVVYLYGGLGFDDFWTFNTSTWDFQMVSGNNFEQALRPPTFEIRDNVTVGKPGTLWTTTMFLDEQSQRLFLPDVWTNQYQGFWVASILPNETYSGTTLSQTSTVNVNTSTSVTTLSPGTGTRTDSSTITSTTSVFTSMSSTTTTLPSTSITSTTSVSTTSVAISSTNGATTVSTSSTTATTTSDTSTTTTLPSASVTSTTSVSTTSVAISSTSSYSITAESTRATTTERATVSTTSETSAGSTTTLPSISITSTTPVNTTSFAISSTTTFGGITGSMSATTTESTSTSTTSDALTSASSTTTRLPSTSFTSTTPVSTISFAVSSTTSYSSTTESTTTSSTTETSVPSTVIMVPTSSFATANTHVTSTSVEVIATTASTATMESMSATTDVSTSYTSSSDAATRDPSTTWTLSVASTTAVRVTSTDTNGDITSSWTALTLLTTRTATNGNPSSSDTSTTTTTSVPLVQTSETVPRSQAQSAPVGMISIPWYVIIVVIAAVALCGLATCVNIYFYRKATSKRASIALSMSPIAQSNQATSFTTSSEAISTPSPFFATATRGYTNFTATYVDQNQRLLAFPAFLEHNLNQFRILKQIAAGGGGTVSLAEGISQELGFGTLFVVKEISNVNERVRRSFEQEVSLMFMLKNEQNIAKLIGFCSDPLMILMKFYPEGSLDGYIHSTRIRKAKSQTFSLALDVAKGLCALHKLGVAHCDIKPQNVLLERDDVKLSAVLTDFGVSRVVTDQTLAVKSFEVSNVRALTIFYAAPEILMAFKRRSVNSDSLSGDVYAFAVSLFELVTGTAAWSKIS